MVTVWYFWHGFIHKGTTFMYLQYSHPALIYYLLPNVWKASYTISVSIFVDVLYWMLYSMDKFITYIVPGPLQRFFLFREEIIITIRWVQWISQRCKSSVTGVHCHENGEKCRLVPLSPCNYKVEEPAEPEADMPPSEPARLFSLK